MLVYPLRVTTASTRRVMLDGDDTIILSSDIGERDECRARRSDYWTSPRAEETLRRVEVIYSSQVSLLCSQAPSLLTR